MKFIKPNMCRFVRPSSAIFEVKLYTFFKKKGKKRCQVHALFKIKTEQ